jgi:hypothetical protein
VVDELVEGRKSCNESEFVWGGRWRQDGFDGDLAERIKRDRFMQIHLKGGKKDQVLACMRLPTVSKNRVDGGHQKREEI